MPGIFMVPETISGPLARSQHALPYSWEGAPRLNVGWCESPKLRLIRRMILSFESHIGVVNMNVASFGSLETRVGEGF